MSDHVVLISGWRPGARKVWATRTIRDDVGLDLAGAKRMIDVALAGGLVHLEVQTATKAKELADELQELNFDASVELVRLSDNGVTQ